MDGRHAADPAPAGPLSTRSIVLAATPAMIARRGGDGRARGRRRGDDGRRGARAARPRASPPGRRPGAGRGRSRPGPIGARPRAHARARPDRGLHRGRRPGPGAAAVDGGQRCGPAITCATSSRRSRASVSGIAAGDPYARGRGVAAVQRPARRPRPAAGCSPRRCRSCCSRSPRGWARARAAPACWSASASSRWRRCSSACWRRMGRGRWALVAVACAAAAEAAIRVAGSDPFPGDRPGRRRVAGRRPRAPGRHRPARPPGAHPGHRAVDPMSGLARRQRGLILASAAAAGAIVLVTLLTTRGAERRPTCRTTLIPAYVPPHALVELARASSRPRLLVINPANGPGAEAAPAYRAAVRTAQRAGARVLGYVHTTYGARPAADVMADIDRYTSWYGVDGIFLDEAAHDVAASCGYYAALAPPRPRRRRPPGRRPQPGRRAGPRVLRPRRRGRHLRGPLRRLRRRDGRDARLGARPAAGARRPPRLRRVAPAGAGRRQPSRSRRATSTRRPARCPTRGAPSRPTCTRKSTLSRSARERRDRDRGRRHDDPAAAAGPRRRARRRERRARRSADLRRR